MDGSGGAEDEWRVATDEQQGRNKLDAWRVGVKINTLTQLTPINLSVAIVIEEASVWQVVGFGNMKIPA